MDINKIINEAVNEELTKKGYIKNKKNHDKPKNSLLKESYSLTVNKFDLKTELLTDKNKSAHQELLENYVKKTNEVSAKLDGVERSDANLNHSNYRSLKIDESYNNNAVFLHSLYFENISDLNSQITTDSLAYMRLTRDFGSFEECQEDFIACAMSARNGWVITGYNIYLGRYVNTIIDLHSENVMIGVIPIVVLDCWEHAYYRDYLSARKKYVHAMMKELNWDIIEARTEKSELISKAMRK